MLNGMLLWAVVTAVVIVGYPLLAAALATVGGGAIWLRGYLVPYTPRFAPQLVSLLPGDPFDHDRELGSLADTVAVGGEKAVEVFEEATLRGGRLDPDVHGEWREAAARYQEFDLSTLAASVADRIPADARAECRWGTDYVVLEGEGGQVLCPRPVAVADLAAIDAMDTADMTGEPAIETRERIAAADPFRALLETCPLCGTDLSVSWSTCCGAAPPGAASDGRQLVCEACPARLYVYN